MKISIETGDLITYGLSIDQYLLCFLLYTSSEDELDRYTYTFGPIPRSRIEDLIERKIIRTRSIDNLSPKNLVLNEEQFLSIINQEVATNWIDEWFEMWPKGVKSGEYYVRTDKVGCGIKMKKFMKKNPSYTKETILDATKRYIFNKSLSNYEYMKLAPNFIDKDGVSILAGECENVLNSQERPQIVQGTLFGGNEL